MEIEMSRISNIAADTKPAPVSLKTGIAKVDAKSIGVAAEGLFYNKV
jgi:hypothetical protein